MDDAAEEETRRNREAEKIALSQHSAANIAALTAMNRTKWAETRETHFAMGINKANLQTVESAIFVRYVVRRNPTGMFNFQLNARCAEEGGTLTRWYRGTLSNGTRGAPLPLSHLSRVGKQELAASCYADNCAWFNSYMMTS